MELTIKKDIDPNKFDIIPVSSVLSELTYDGKYIASVPNDYVPEVIALMSLAQAAYNVFNLREPVSSNPDDLTGIL